MDGEASPSASTIVTVVAANSRAVIGKESNLIAPKFTTYSFKIYSGEVVSGPQLSLLSYLRDDRYNLVLLDYERNDDDDEN